MGPLALRRGCVERVALLRYEYAHLRYLGTPMLRHKCNACPGRNTICISYCPFFTSFNLSFTWLHFTSPCRLPVTRPKGQHDGFATPLSSWTGRFRLVPLQSFSRSWLWFSRHVRNHGIGTCHPDDNVPELVLHSFCAGLHRYLDSNPFFKMDHC